MLLAVGVAYIGQHAVAPATAKVQVDIGRVAPRRVQETLEQQIVLQRINRGDFNAIGNQRVGDAAAGADRDAVFARIAHDIGHQQKEGREAVVGDGCQLALQARLRRGAGILAKAPLQTRCGCLGKRCVWGVTRFQLQRRPDRPSVRNGRLAGSSDVRGCLQRLRRGNEARRDLVRLEPVEVDGGVAAVGKHAPRRLVQVAVLVDGSQQLEARSVLARQRIDRLHGNRGYAKSLTDGGDFSGDCLIFRPVDFQREPGLLVIQPGEQTGMAHGRAPVVCSEMAFNPAAPPA